MKIKITFEENAPDFLKISKRESNPQKRVRLMAMALLKKGRTMSGTAASLGVNRHTVGEWYRRYVNYGLDGLDNLPRSGRPSKISSEQEEAFIQRIENLQESKKGGRVTGYDIQEMARTEFNADYATRSIYTVLERLDISWVTARSKHPKVDEDAQNAFKKILQKSS